MHIRTAVAAMILVFATGCPSTDPGIPLTDINTVISTQEDATKTIEKHGKGIQTSSKDITKEVQDVRKAVASKDIGKVGKHTDTIDTKNNTIFTSAAAILVENKRLQGQVVSFKALQEERDEQLKTVESQKEQIATLENRLSATFRTITYALYGFGSLLLAGGIFLSFYMHKGELLWLSAAGAVLIVVAVAGVWIEDNIGWILAALGIVGAYMALRPTFLAKRGLKAAVEAAEVTKRELNKADPEAVERLYGPASGGPGGIVQDEHQKALIHHMRKSLHKKWSPTMGPRVTKP